MNFWAKFCLILLNAWAELITITKQIPINL